MGMKDYEANKERYKFDALDYYKIDTMWLSFQTIPLMYKVLIYVTLNSKIESYSSGSMIVFYIQVVNLII